MHANDFGLPPETGEIQSLLDDLLPSAAPPPPARNGTNGIKVSPAARLVLGAHTVAAFLRGVNWANAAGYRSPFVPIPAAAAPAGPDGARRVMGALPLREFLRGVNWTNAAAPPALDVYVAEAPDHARLVLDTFMNEIAWD